MPFHAEKLSPYARVAYEIASDYPSAYHPLAIAFLAEMATEWGNEQEWLRGFVQLINTLRAEVGLPPIEGTTVQQGE